MTLMVKGTWASELRTRFWPIRLTYSVTTGSWTIFTLFSTCIAYCLPILISLSSEYQLPMPRPPTLRLPMASTSFLLPSCLTLLSSGSWMGCCAALELGLGELAEESGVWGGVGTGSWGGVVPPVGEPAGIVPAGGSLGNCESVAAGLLGVWALLSLGVELDVDPCGVRLVGSVWDCDACGCSAGLD